MEIFTAFLGLMDKTIVAMLGVPVLAIFLVGSLITAVVGLFLILKETASRTPYVSKKKKP